MCDKCDGRLRAISKLGHKSQNAQPHPTPRSLLFLEAIKPTDELYWLNMRHYLLSHYIFRLLFLTKERLGRERERDKGSAVEMMRFSSSSSSLKEISVCPVFRFYEHGLIGIRVKRESCTDTKERSIRSVE